MSVIGWLVGILVILAITVVIARRRNRLTASRHQPAPVVVPEELEEEPVEESEEAPPIHDVIPLGHGITLIMPHSASVKMPHDPGRGAGQYKLAVRTLFAETFGLTSEALAEQDVIWDEWRATKRDDEPRNLLELIKGDVADAFKARAATVLIIPALRFSPFAWESDF